MTLPSLHPAQCPLEMWEIFMLYPVYCSVTCAHTYQITSYLCLSIKFSQADSHIRVWKILRFRDWCYPRLQGWRWRQDQSMNWRIFHILVRLSAHEDFYRILLARKLQDTRRRLFCHRRSHISLLSGVISMSCKFLALLCKLPNT